MIITHNEWLQPGDDSLKSEMTRCTTPISSHSAVVLTLNEFDHIMLLYFRKIYIEQLNETEINEKLESKIIYILKLCKNLKDVNVQKRKNYVKF